MAHTQQSFTSLLVSAINANTLVGLQESIAANPTMMDVNGDVAAYAAKRGQIDMLEGVLPIVPENGRVRAFYVAATYGQIACTQMLLPVVEGGFDQALKVAVEHQQVAMVEWLLDNVRCEEGLLQAMFSLYDRPRDREIFSLLYKHGGRAAVNSVAWAHAQMWGDEQQLIQWADEEDFVVQNHTIVSVLNNLEETSRPISNRGARKL